MVCVSPTVVVSMMILKPRVLLIALMLLAALLPVLAEEPPPTHQGTTVENALLWRIEQPGRAPSYLFGTIHSADPRVTHLPEPVAAAFQASDALVLELIPTAEAILATTELMFYGDGTRLSQVLDAERYTRALEALETHGIESALVDHMRPWAVAVTLAYPRNGGQDFLDLRLYTAAQALDMEVHGLETVREQLAAFTALSTEDEIQLLVSVLDHLDEIATLNEDVHEAYLARDLDTLLRLSEEWMMTEDTVVWRALMDELLNARNHRMASRMTERLAAGGSFVAVGALHLPGESGLVQLLRRQGYAVTPVY